MLADRIRRHERLRLRATQLAVGILVATLAVAWLLLGTPNPHRPATRGTDGVPVGLPGVVTRVGVHHDGPLLCGDYHITVTLAPASRHGLTVYGQLCAAAGFHGDRAELDWPDAGYDHRLFAWPVSRYDYARAVDGRVTLAIDPLGTGASDHPDGASLTISTQAWVAHQLVTDLRTGILGDGYRQVIEVGSGTGAQVAVTEASRWHDVSAVIALDAGHTRTLPTTHLTAATTDPRLRDQPWASHGYLTIPTGTRCATSYYPPGTPPGVCARDEDLEGRQPVPVGLVAEPADLIWTAATVTAPVLLVVDASDPNTCPTAPCTGRSPAVRQLAAAFRTAPRRALWIQPDAGRLGLLHRSGPLLAGLVNRWLRQQILQPLNNTTAHAARRTSGTAPAVWPRLAAGSTDNSPDGGRDASQDDGDLEADMSRYPLPSHDPNVSISAGWDRYHATFFVAVYNYQTHELISAGTAEHRLVDPRAAVKLAAEHADIPAWLESQLYTDVLREPIIRMPRGPMSAVLGADEPSEEPASHDPPTAADVAGIDLD